MKTNIALLLAVSIAIVGCNNTAKTPAAGPTPTKGGTDQKAENPTVASIPAELKKDAFDYYGLGNEQPIDMEVVQSGGATSTTGTQYVTLKEVKGGEAIFEIGRTGNLEMYGTQTVTLNDKGVYLTSSTTADIEGDRLELPNDLTPGRTWKNHLKIKGEREMDVVMNCKVVGVQKFTTKAGEREGLLITASGSGTLGGQKVTMDSKSWYVRGKGGLKSELVTTMPDGKKQIVTIQETK